jgi:sulfite exporter TauE/SafE
MTLNLALIVSGAMLGVASGGHCIAMCGAGSSYCLGSSASQTPRAAARRIASFHVGRITGYASVGALLGGAAAAFHVLTEWISLLRPLWTMANTAMFLLGMALLITARQPRMLTTLGEKVGQWIRKDRNEKAIVMHERGNIAASLASSPLAGVPVGAGVQSEGNATLRGQRRGLLLGLSWAFIPCGPLYSAWTLALFAGDPLSGALTAAAFAAASGGQLAFAQWWFGKRPRGARSAQGSHWDRIGIRIAGAALSFSAAYSIVMLVSGAQGPGLFCL